MSPTSQFNKRLSTLYHALKATRRRHVINLLDETSSRKLSTRELAREIASKEKNVSTKNATGEPYRNVYNALTQTHLPTLSEAGIIIYDSERQLTLPGRYFDLASLLLDTNTATIDVVSALTDDTENNSSSDQ